MKKYSQLIFVIIVFVLTIVLLIDTEDVSAKKNSQSSNVTGTLKILWNDSIEAEPLVLVSESPFSLTLIVDVKMIQNQKIFYWYGIPTYRIMNQFDNLYAPTEVGTDTFKIITYSNTITNVLIGSYAEWIRPRWILVTSYPVYVESTGDLFTQTFSGTWRFSNSNNVEMQQDAEGFFYNRIVRLGWPYRVYLPIIMKSGA